AEIEGPHQGEDQQQGDEDHRRCGEHPLAVSVCPAGIALPCAGLTRCCCGHQRLLRGSVLGRPCTRHGRPRREMWLLVLVVEERLELRLAILSGGLDVATGDTDDNRFTDDLACFS